MTVLLLEPVSFSGIESGAERGRKAEAKAEERSERSGSKKRSLETHFILYLENCTARWKKHLVKKPVANVFKRTHERRNANNFAVGLRRKKLSKIEKSIL